MNDVAKAVSDALSGPKTMCVGVRFPETVRQLGRPSVVDGKTYDYFIQPGDTPKIGDAVITDFSLRANTWGSNPAYADCAVEEMSFGLVVKVYASIKTKAVKPYLMLVSADLLAQRKMMQEEIAQRFIRKNEAFEALKGKFEEAQMFKLFEQMAQDDPSIAGLLAAAKWNPGEAG